jgi:hypothetical protein
MPRALFDQRRFAIGAALAALILTFGPISGADDPSRTLNSDVGQGVGPDDTSLNSVGEGDGGVEMGRHRRASDVWPVMVLLLLAPATRLDASPKRIRRHLRTVVGDLGMLPPQTRSHTIRGCKLHHRRLLVHRINLIRQPSRNHRPVLLRHIRRHPPSRRTIVHRRTNRRRPRCDLPVSLASSKVARTDKRGTRVFFRRSRTQRNQLDSPG